MGPEEQNMPDRINTEPNHVINSFDRGAEIAFTRSRSQERQNRGDKLTGGAYSISARTLITEPATLPQNPNDTLAGRITEPIESLSNFSGRQRTAAVFNKRLKRRNPNKEVTQGATR